MYYFNECSIVTLSSVSLLVSPQVNPLSATHQNDLICLNTSIHPFSFYRTFLFTVLKQWATVLVTFLVVLSEYLEDLNFNFCLKFEGIVHFDEKGIVAESCGSCSHYTCSQETEQLMSELTLFSSFYSV